MSLSTSLLHPLTSPVYQGFVAITVSQLIRDNVIRGGSQWWSLNQPSPLPLAPKRNSMISRVWFSLPQPVRYFVSGNFGNLLFFACDKVIGEHINDDTPHKDTISFFAAYMTHIAGQHLLHAFLVYGLESINTRKKYISTLRGMYAALMTAAVGSTILNGALLHWGLPKTQAFVTTLVIFACINYVWIGKIVERQQRLEREASLLIAGNKKGYPTISRRRN